MVVPWRRNRLSRLKYDPGERVVLQIRPYTRQVKLNVDAEVAEMVLRVRHPKSSAVAASQLHRRTARLRLPRPQSEPGPRRGTPLRYSARRRFVADERRHPRPGSDFRGETLATDRHPPRFAGARWKSSHPALQNPTQIRCSDPAQADGHTATRRAARQQVPRSATPRGNVQEAFRAAQRRITAACALAGLEVRQEVVEPPAGWPIGITIAVSADEHHAVDCRGPADSAPDG